MLSLASLNVPTLLSQNAERKKPGLELRVEFLLRLATRALNLTVRMTHELQVEYGLEIPEIVNKTIELARELLEEARAEYEKGNYTGAAKLAMLSMRNSRRALIIVTKLARAEVRGFREAEEKIRARGILVAIERFRAHLERLKELAESAIEDEEVLKGVLEHIDKAFELLDQAEEKLKAGEVNASARLLGEARKEIAGIEGVIFPRAQIKGLRIRFARYIRRLLNASIGFLRRLHGLDIALRRLAVFKVVNQTLLPTLVRARMRLLNETLRDLSLLRELVSKGNVTAALKLLMRIRFRLRRLALLQHEIPKLERRVEKIKLENATEALKELVKELQEKLEAAKEILKDVLKPEVFEEVEVRLNKTIELLEEVQELIEEGNFSEAWKIIHKLKMELLKDLRGRIAHLVRKAAEMAPGKWKEFLRNATMAKELEELRKRISDLRKQAAELRKTATQLIRKVRRLLKRVTKGPAHEELLKLFEELENTLEKIDSALLKLEGLEAKIRKISPEEAEELVEDLAKELADLANTLAQIAQEVEEI